MASYFCLDKHKTCRKHKFHRHQLQQSKPWRDSEKGASKDTGRGKGKGRKMGQEESRVDDNTPPQKLSSRNLEGVAKYIKDGKARKIVVMTGAGISTSAGIPDFRSSDTGLYANLARLNLPYAEAVFDISYFRNNPHPFYTLAHELYPGRYRPTISHSFLKLLHQKGLLLKLFTQNIDCLEREAGVPEDIIVEAHGSFAKQSCIDCKTPYPHDLMQKAIHEKQVPHCQQENCKGLVKPDIVFFGEALPSDFFDNRYLLSQADLCIIMGTSLSVHPFASLPQFVGESVPRVLINLEQVGGIGSRTDDVLLLGDCDEGVRKLAKACGWLEELEALWVTTAPKDGKQENKAKKDRDEQFQEDMDKLTKEIERTLELGEEQHQWLENHLEDKARKGLENDNILQPTENDASAAEKTGKKDGPSASDSASQPYQDPIKDSKTDVASKLETATPEPEGGGLRHVFVNLEPNLKPLL
ncbi:NAD-dependent deacetylase sirtuin-2 [Delitschia confertaspora ATCC 74209]|uniref:NAD-dependent deacetylase sirtuin-2 n=1 Tax=Delitschia confertaspora ATCC 74209 TaxID=1513339 RepID=A0A9P4JJZ0_9PLEO|nr:NAD-dependent deacetylase sirtuin-2 [Delitschia confertaspora ATCC 74209]